MATPAQAADALLALLGRISDFTCDEFERKQLVAHAIEKGRCPLAICPCGKVVLAEDVPGVIEAVPVEDRGVWLPPPDGLLCGACVFQRGGFPASPFPSPTTTSRSA